MSRRRLLLALLFLSQSFNFASALQPILLTESGLMSPIQASLVLAFASLLSGLLQPAIGSVIDQCKVKRSFVFVLAAYGVGVFGYLSKSSPLWLLVSSCILLVMASLTVRTVVATALIASCQGQARREAALLRYLVSNAALVVSSALALLFFGKYRGLLLGLDLLTTMLLVGGMLSHLRKRPDGTLRMQSSMRASARILKGAMSLHKRRIVGLSLVSVCFAAHLIYLPLLFAKRGLISTDTSAMILLANALVVVLSVRYLRKYTDHWRQGKVGKIGITLLSLGMGLAPLTQNWSLVLVGIAIWTLGETLFVPWEQLQLFQCFESSSAGTAAGAVSFLGSLNQVIAPALAALMLALPDGVASGMFFVLPIAGYWISRSVLKRSDAQAAADASSPPEEIAQAG